MEYVGHERLLVELCWAEGMDLLWPVAEQLERKGLVRRHALMGPSLALQPSYAGLVWQTRRGYTVEARVLDHLIAEWETTSVDFKREVHTNTASEKAELVKDLLGLGNTQASGQRWLIIGFDPKTHRYSGAPDHKLTQDHLEQILSVYTQPNLGIRYDLVDYRSQPVGKIEVLRDRRRVPYRVKQSVGDKGAGGKRIEVGQVFVRHGSQTVIADADEVAALEAEAAWASGRDGSLDA